MIAAAQHWPDRRRPELSGGNPEKRQQRDAGQPATPHRQVGCLECRQTGYLGRTGVYELMPVAGALRSALDAKTDLAELRRLATRSGMRSLRLTGAEKVALDLT